MSGYLVIGLRYINRHKLFSLINALGLSLGLGTFFLIIQYVGFETGYDRFHRNVGQLYRVNSTRIDNDKESYRTALSVANAGPFLKEKVPGVTGYTRLFSMRFNFVCAVSYTHDGKTTTFNERNVYYADSEFLDTFSFPLLTGAKGSALSEPFTVVISRIAARKYFGEQDPIGKTIRLLDSSEQHDYVISGVFESKPGPSHLELDFLFSYASLRSSLFNEEAFDNWEWDGIYTYVVTDRRMDADAINHRLHDYLLSGSELNSGFFLDLQPVTDIHLTSDHSEEPTLTGSRAMMNLLLVIACFIVLLAWINYANLMTADALRRAKEVGLRRIAGARSRQIISQFLIQFLLVNLMALALAFVLVEFLGPIIHALIGMPGGLIVSGLPVTPLVVFFVLGMAVAGAYPAFFLLRLKPGASIRGSYLRGPDSSIVRQVLVVLQFCTSIALITGTFIVNRQLSFMQHSDLGMRIDNTLVIKAPIFADSTSEIRLTTFENRLRTISNVVDVARSSTEPAGAENGWVADVRREEDQRQGVSMIVNVIDRHFVDAFGIALLAGRDFLPSEYRNGKFGSRTESILVNESAIRELGFDSDEAAIDHKVYWGENVCVIVGVVADFHQRSLHFPVEPAIFLLDKNAVYYSISIRNADENVPATLSTVEEAFKNLFPEDPFEYFFLQDRFNGQYQLDQRFSALFNLFTFLAVFIACLGLSGLVAFFLLHRKKEIAVRKVLGAPLMSILGLVSKRYLMLGLVSVVVIAPISYLATAEWLETFAYHIDLHWWMFVVPGLLVLLLALLVVAGQTAKSATTNPADCLGSE